MVSKTLKKKGSKVSKTSPTTTEVKNLSIIAQPTDFFKEQICQALQNQKIKIDEHTEFYLVNLLTRFISAENLFIVDKDGTKQQETLALLLNESLASPDPIHKQRGLRRLGDISLYTAGFFSDSFARKVVDVDYYIGMGRNAYGNLAHLGFDALFQKVFIELSERFHKFVDVLAEVSIRSGGSDAKNILRQYEVWLKTGSEQAEKSLKEAGIIPNAVVKPDWQ